jgi:hypothetical protein
MNPWVIGFLMLCFVAFVGVWSLCRAAGLADRRIDEMRRNSENPVRCYETTTGGCDSRDSFGEFDT